MKKILIVIICFVATNCFCQQKFLDATLTESWPSKGRIKVPSDYNRISSYLYVLNKQELLNIFSGVEYTKEERKKLGIKKNDKPDLLQLSIKIAHPDLYGEEALTVPLFLYDTRNDKSKKAFSNFNGMILNDINAKNIGSDVMGNINVNALISNSSVKFWQDVAKISADFGKSAVSLALGNSAAVTELKGKLSTYIDKGINGINDLSGDEKLEDYSFFVELIDREASQEFDEIVIAARLYEIHWSTNTPNSTEYFKSLNDSASLLPSTFQTLVDNKSNPIVIVVETRTRTKINLGTPKFTQEYRNQIRNEYNEFPESDWEMLRSYSNNFGTAFKIYNYIISYQNSNGTNELDWNALINALDFTYIFKTSVDNDNTIFTSDIYSQIMRDRYKVIEQRYNKVESLLDQLFLPEINDINLEKALKIIGMLIKGEEANLNSESLYSKLITISNYDNFVRSIDPEGKTFTNTSYTRAKTLRKVYEKELYKKISATPPATTSAKITFYEEIKEKYPLCEECVSSASSKITQLKGENDQATKDQYSLLSKNQYNSFNNCRKLIESQFSEIESKIDTLDEFDQRLAKESFDKLKTDIERWKNSIGLNPKDEDSESVYLWISAINESRRGIKESYESLEASGIAEKIECDK